MILNKFHTRQTSTSSAPTSRPSLHQRRDSYQHHNTSHHHTSSHHLSEPLPSEVDEKTPPATPNKVPAPTWLNMPNKLQLLILALSRLVDFWQMASLQSYMVYQLRSFDATFPDSTISHQAGILQGAFTAAQVVTSILWGRAADAPSMGRKNVLLIGLVGTGISCVGVGFSDTFWKAAVWRVVGGAVNGTVGAARTMVAESVGREWHSRAFLLLPVAFNVANILGPIVGGLLVDPIKAYPMAFGTNSIFGGSIGVQWMSKYPYALPSLLCTILLFAEAVAVAMFLHETLPSSRGSPNLLDQMTEMFAGIKAILRGQPRYSPLRHEMRRKVTPLPGTTLSEKSGNKVELPSRLPFAQIWTSNVLWTLLSVAIFDFHMGAFSGLWIIFLSTTRSSLPATSAFHFTGGLSFSPASLGLSLSILGTVGLMLQVLLYPWANGRFGLMRCFRLSLFLFPAAYFLAPYLALLPSSALPPLPAAGFWVWTGISLILALQVTARTFALPASIILVNNASPHPSVLGTIHGVGQSVSSAFRTIGPVASGYWYGKGLEKGTVGLSWWIVAGISGIGCVASFWVRNGSGHEILLPGEEEGKE